MPKGKNFSAAEKHFAEKEQKYKRIIDDYKRELREAKKIISEKDREYEALITTVAQLQEWNERLLKYMDISEEDIKKVVEKDKASADMSMLLNRANIRSTYQHRWCNANVLAAEEDRFTETAAGIKRGI